METVLLFFLIALTGWLPSEGMSLGLGDSCNRNLQNLPRS